MAKHTFGLANVEMGAIAGDGGMGTVLEAIGETVSGTAQMTTEDPTITDFNIEESDSPVESVVSTAGKISLAWSTYDVSGYNMYKFFGGTYTPHKSIATFGTVVGGTLYTNGTYTNVPLTGGTGQQARATIVVAGGVVTTVTLTQGGYGYTVADSMSALAANIGGTGSGFSVPVATLSNGSATTSTWSAPDAFPDVEVSLKITDKKGNIVIIPRAKVSPKLGLSFAKDKLGQVDLTASVLQPTKSGEARMKITYA
ncbi:MAG: hypothetical protein ABIT05_01395 [Chitinophagaceae bacterium]